MSKMSANFSNLEAVESGGAVFGATFDFVRLEDKNRVKFS